MIYCGNRNGNVVDDGTRVAVPVGGRQSIALTPVLELSCAHAYPWSRARDIIHALNEVARKRVLVSRALAPASSNGAETAE